VAEGGVGGTKAPAAGLKGAAIAGGGATLEDLTDPSKAVGPGPPAAAAPRTREAARRDVTRPSVEGPCKPPRHTEHANPRALWPATRRGCAWVRTPYEGTVQPRGG